MRKLLQIYNLEKWKGNKTKILQKKEGE